MDRLYRSSTNRVIGGVCGGLAEYFNIDPLIVRILFVTLAFMFSGMGLPLYLLLWLFIPQRDMPFADHDDSIRQNVQDIKDTLGDMRDRTFGASAQAPNPAQRWNNTAPGDRLLIGGAVLVGLGLLLLLRNLHVLGFLNELWPLGVIAVGILILIQNLKK